MTHIKLSNEKLIHYLDKLCQELGIPRNKIIETLVESIIKGRSTPIELLENPLIICSWIKNAITILEKWLEKHPQDLKLIKHKIEKLKIIYEILKDSNICI